MRNVEKFIRILGYIVYVMLWSPVIVLALVILPIMALYKGLKIGMTVEQITKGYLESLKFSVMHDVNFIKTGKWL